MEKSVHLFLTAATAAEGISNHPECAMPGDGRILSGCHKKTNTHVDELETELNNASKKNISLPTCSRSCCANDPDHVSLSAVISNLQKEIMGLVRSHIDFKAIMENRLSEMENGLIERQAQNLLEFKSALLDSMRQDITNILKIKELQRHNPSETSVSPIDNPFHARSEGIIANFEPKNGNLSSPFKLHGSCSDVNFYDNLNSPATNQCSSPVPVLDPSPCPSTDDEDHSLQSAAALIARSSSLRRSPFRARLGLPSPLPQRPQRPGPRTAWRKLQRMARKVPSTSARERQLEGSRGGGGGEKR